MMAALIRPIFNAEWGEQARLLGEAIARLERPLPSVGYGAYVATPSNEHELGARKSATA
jgi:hypothetical protein